MFSKFERILEAATDGIVTLDKEGRYTYANAAAERILGVDRVRIIQNQTEWKLTTLKSQPLPDDETPFKKVLLEGQAVYDLKCMVERQDGRVIVISTNAAPLYDEAGNLDGVVGIFTDITTTHELQERHNVFLQTVAHDLRGPLTVILGYAEALLAPLQPGDIESTNISFATEILKSSEKMESMIEELLDTARMEGASVNLHKEPIPLKSFVGDMLHHTCQKSMPMERFEFKILTDLPAVSANPEHLERIMMNLLSNAFKFSPSDSKVTIQARKYGDDIMISVIDQGPGITPSDRSRLFQRYAQVPGRDSPGGVGLGLYITRLLVEAHGGKIWIESKVGHGSTFNFTLPTVSEDSA